MEKQIENTLKIMRWNVNNLYGWGISQKLPTNNFEWIEDTSQIIEDFIKSQNEESNEGYFLEVNVQYPEKLHDLYNDLQFLPKRMKIYKVEKFVTNLHEYVIHIRSLKQVLNQGLVLTKVDRVITFKQKAWSKSYTDMKTDLRKKSKK